MLGSIPLTSVHYIKEVTSLSNLQSPVAVENKPTFEIRVPGRVFVLCAEKREDMHFWIEGKPAPHA